MLRSAEYDDIYFNPDDGLGESRYVFLDGIDAPRIWQDKPQFNITELGFGTGLNYLLTAKLWHDTAAADAHLTYCGIDLHPLPKTELEKIYPEWPELKSVANDFLAVYPETSAGIHISYAAPNITLMLCWGEVIEMLQSIRRRQNAFYLDGFAPQKNPQMWRDEIYPELARIAAPGAIAATFTAAGSVKRGLEAAGFNVTKTKGFGHKRERIIAHNA